MPTPHRLLLRDALPPFEVTARVARVAAEKLGIRVPIGTLPPTDVLAGRENAIEVVAAHEQPDILDFTGIAVASPPYLDELHHAWPRAVPENMSEDVAAAWRMIDRTRTDLDYDEPRPATALNQNEGPT